MAAAFAFLPSKDAFPVTFVSISNINLDVDRSIDMWIDRYIQYTIVQYLRMAQVP